MSESSPTENPPLPPRPEGDQGDAVPADDYEAYKAERRGMFAAQHPVSEEEHARILEAYHNDFADINRQDALIRSHGEPEAEEEVQRLNLSVAFTRPSLARDDDAETTALKKRDAWEAASGKQLSERQWQLMREHAHANDGWVEQLREWAQGRRYVPVEYFNEMMNQVDAIRYDTIAEERRLKFSMQGNMEYMEGRLRDCEDRCHKSREDARVSGELDGTLSTLRDVVDRIAAETREQDSFFAQQDPPEGMGETQYRQELSGETESISKKYEDARRALADRDAADTAVEEANGDDDNTVKTTSELGDAYKIIYQEIGTFRNLAQSRLEASKRHARFANNPRLPELENINTRVTHDCRILYGLLTRLRDQVAAREATRAARRELQRKQTAAIRDAKEPVKLNIKLHDECKVPASMLHESQNNVDRLRTQLTDSQAMVSALERALRGAKDRRVDNLLAIAEYRNLVAQDIRAELETKVYALEQVLDNAKYIGNQFETLKLNMRKAGVSEDDPPGTQPSDVQSELQTATSQIEQLFQQLPVYFEKVKGALEKLASDIERPEETSQQDTSGSKSPKDEIRDRYTQAEFQVTLEKLKKENERLTETVQQFKDAGIDAQDNEGLTRVLNSAGDQRERADKLFEKTQEFREKYKYASERLENMEAKVDNLLEENKSLYIQITRPRDHNEKLEQRARELESERETLNQRVAVAEERLKDMAQTLEDTSGKLMLERLAHQQRGPDGTPGVESDDEKINRLQERVESLESAVKRAERSKDGAEMKVQSVMNDVEVAAKNLHEEKGKREMQRKQMLNNMEEAIKNALEQAGRQHTALTEAHKKELDRLKKSLKTLQSENMSLRVEVLELQQQMRDANKSENFHGIAEADRPDQADRVTLDALDHAKTSEELRAAQKQAKSDEMERENLANLLDETTQFNQNLLEQVGELQEKLTAKDIALDEAWSSEDRSPMNQYQYNHRLEEIHIEVEAFMDKMSTSNGSKRRKLQKAHDDSGDDDGDDGDGDGGMDSDRPIWNDGLRKSLFRVNNMLMKRGPGSRIKTTGQGREGGQANEDGARPSMTTKEFSAFFRSSEFQKRRQAVTHKVNINQFEDALRGLDDIDLWLESSGGWRQYYKESEVLAPLLYLRAYVLASQGLDMRLVGTEGWEESFADANMLLERAEDMREEDDLNEEDEEEVQRQWKWQRLGRLAKFKMEQAQQPNAKVPVCGCKFRTSPCHLHGVDQHEGRAREKARYHHIVELEKCRSAQLLLKEEVAQDLEPFSISSCGGEGRGRRGLSAASTTSMWSQR